MIPLRELRRIRRDLERASAVLNRHYPTGLQDWTGDSSDLETSRNLDTALAHISGWIGYRVENRSDPYLQALIASKSPSEMGE